LYSRTNDFADGFAEVLDMADEVILLPIYPARELPMEGVTSQMIIDRMHSEVKMVLGKEDLLKHLQQEKDAHVEEGFDGLLLITAGAGDIDAMVGQISLILKD
jgi:UDP-N-acetylmuramate--alanine ligase